MSTFEDEKNKFNDVCEELIIAFISNQHNYLFSHSSIEEIEEEAEKYIRSICSKRDIEFFYKIFHKYFYKDSNIRKILEKQLKIIYKNDTRKDIEKRAEIHIQLTKLNEINSVNVVNENNKSNINSSIKSDNNIFSTITIIICIIGYIANFIAIIDHWNNPITIGYLAEFTGVIIFPLGILTGWIYIF